MIIPFFPPLLQKGLDELVLLVCASRHLFPYRAPDRLSAQAYPGTIPGRIIPGEIGEDYLQYPE